jgi:hypothetical protein
VATGNWQLATGNWQLATGKKFKMVNFRFQKPKGKPKGKP